MINHEEILLRWWFVYGGWHRVTGYNNRFYFILREWHTKEEFQNMEWCVIPEEVRDVKLYQPS